MRNEVFLDTSFVIASLSTRDQFHSYARAIDSDFRSRRTSIVTTSGVLLEIGNSLAKVWTRGAGGKAIQMLLDDPMVEVVHIDEELLARGLRLYETRADKEWGLVDCVSFLVMWDRGITEALSSDEHFGQAGLIALLRQ